MPKLLARSLIAAMLAAIIATVIVAQSAQAAPANPVPFTITQPDGTTFSARQWGDEWNNGFETVDGYTIVQDATTGYWVYAAGEVSTSLSPALVDSHMLIVGKDQPVGLSRGLRPGILNPNPNIESFASIAPLSQNFGTQKVLVLLVDFPDQPYTYTAADFASLFFGPANSVKSFYEQASRSNFTLSPAEETSGVADGVVGWLRMSYNHINTGQNTSLANVQLAKDALVAANPYVNYASFDTDHNGYISTNELHIIVIVAGYEASYNTNSPSVWGHRSSIYGIANPPLDGVYVGNSTFGGGYAQFGEKHGDHIATIGIMAHELGHDITWPDLYDTSLVTEGVGEWSIMGSGSWDNVAGYPGSSPALPDAWLRWYQGWQTPVEIKGMSIGVTLDPIETTGNSYLLGANPDGVDWNFYVESGVGEYFLVENRQKIGYDGGLPGCGLLIWHIDESKIANNTANQGTHPLVFLEQADGLNHLMSGYNRGDAGDAFPGSLNKTSFTNLTNPNSNLYSGSDSGTRLFNIISTPSVCSLATPASIKATLIAPGIGDGPKVFIPTVLMPASVPANRGIYGTVTDHGTPLGGVQVQLRFYDGITWSTAATTTTAPDGLYSFKNSVSLSAGQVYYVLFPNAENDNNRLYYWGTKTIAAYSLGQEINIGDFDVADIVIGNPSSGTATPFPVTFNWTRRAATLTDSYHLLIYRESDWSFVYDSGPLGYVASKTLGGLQSGMSFNTLYGWFPVVTSADGGFGESYYYKRITFLTASSPSVPLWSEMTVPRAKASHSYYNEN
jgi:M6 family metalloprotease-like protein